MKPLGLSFLQMAAGRRMDEAGGRLFVDLTPELASPASRSASSDMLGKSDPLIKDALQTVLDRGDFIQTLPDDFPTGRRRPPKAAPSSSDPSRPIPRLLQPDREPRGVLAALKRDIGTKSGPALLDFIVEDVAELSSPVRSAEPSAFMSAMAAASWINDRCYGVVGGEERRGRALAVCPEQRHVRDGPGGAGGCGRNRRHPDVVAYLQEVKDEGFLDELVEIMGGRESRDAIRALDIYGMRGAGEIDITRPVGASSHHARPPYRQPHREIRARRRRTEVRAGAAGGQEKKETPVERVRNYRTGSGRPQRPAMIDRVRSSSGTGSTRNTAS